MCLLCSQNLVANLKSLKRWSCQSWKFCYLADWEDVEAGAVEGADVEPLWTQWLYDHSVPRPDNIDTLHAQYARNMELYLIA